MHQHDLLTPWLLQPHNETGPGPGPFAKWEEERFRQEILAPSLKLHEDLQSSRQRYEMRHVSVNVHEHEHAFDKVSVSVSPQEIMLPEWQLKDANTWQGIRNEKDVLVGRARARARALYCLHPALVRFRARDAPPVVVAKAVVVVECFTTDGFRRGGDR